MTVGNKHLLSKKLAPSRELKDILIITFIIMVGIKVCYHMKQILAVIGKNQIKEAYYKFRRGSNGLEFKQRS